MNTDKRKVLNGYHVVFLAQNLIIGTGLLSLPQKISAVGYSQWMLPIVFGIMATITLWPMIWINSKYPQENLFSINEKVLGKWMGKIVNSLFIVYFVFILASLIDNYMLLMQTTALAEHSITLPIVFFLLVLVYIVNGGIKSIARFCIMSFFLTILLLFFLRWSIEKGELSHIFPLFNFNWTELEGAMRKGFMSILGYELIMVYFPYIISQKKAFKHTVIGVWISITIYFITTLVSVMYYSEWQLKHIDYSVLNLLKAGNLSFVERIDVLGVTLWIFLVLSTTAGYLWASKKSLESLLSKSKHYHSYILVAAVFLVMMIPIEREYKEKLFENIFYVSFLMILWPLFLIVVHLIKKKQVR
ncbi:GerAB/ArcD/ProY family transporter [Psychrobacillus sp.]|uniref:GerAB/ArcD/ProY family transporter n=1 Tax=Psychrobacillus sp. TaxID=1871623 RepID=UPI0028BE6447|nr:GerAB/ArcD/ProY family transporter [Psychrobacillus sp.]